jgi:hypothetical protein
VLWVDPAKVEVRCVDGNVALHGRLDTRSDTNLLIELTKRLDGVASLVDGLGWEYDNMKVDVGGAPYGANPRSGW